MYCTLENIVCQSDSIFIFAERGLNQEIEQMIEETTLQKRRIAELESQLASRVTHLSKEPYKTQIRVQPEKRPKSKSPISVPRDKRGDGIPRHTSCPEIDARVRSSLSLCDLS
jgi:hypothetical protein